MEFEKFNIEGPVLCKPKIIKDERGFFAEIYRRDLLEDFSNEKFNFCQGNISKSKKGVLRGLHFQTYPYAQTKLVSVSKGEILDLIIDIRKESKTYGKGIQIILNDTNHYQLLVPKGFAHGFLVLSNIAEVHYKVDNYYKRDCEYGINSLDPKLNFDLEAYCNKITRSQKDSISPNLKDLPKFRFHQ
tara:strand:- start:2112 stop:2672 length:561 start_codon:yes stop_codon:yes gene_type:complete